MKIKLKRKEIAGIIILLIATINLIIISNIEENTSSYFIELVLLVASIVLLNDNVLITANSLFTVYFCYSVAIGPLFLLRSHINYGYNYTNIILGSLLAFSWGNAVANRNRSITKIEDKNIIRFNFSRIRCLRILFIVSMLATTYYLYKNRALLLGGNIQSGRVAASSGNGMILYISQLSILVVPMMLEAYYIGKRKKIVTIRKAEIILAAIIASVTLVASGYRAPVMTMFICLAVLIITNDNINNTKIIAMGVAFVIAVEILGMARQTLSGGSSTKGIFASLGTSLIVNNINLHYVFNTFPEKVAYQHGFTYLINFIMLRPGPDLDFTLWLKQQIGINFAGGGVTPTIIGEFYMNFGMLGAYIGMFALGILGNEIYKYFIRHSKSFLSVFYICQFAHSVSGGIANVIITVIFYTILYWILMMFPLYSKKKMADYEKE
jgi:oligosaccharide repeat unit polymerase